MKVLFAVKDLPATDMLGIMYLSSMAKMAGHEVEISDLNLHALRQKISSFNPAVIGYSIATHNRRDYLEINSKLKAEYKFVSIFGGPHPTYFPDCISEDGVDAICIGEGEYPFAEFLNNLEKGLPIAGIANLWVKQDGNIYRNDIRPLINDLDVLPFPDRDLFDIPGRERKNSQSFIASRGCAFSCTFCFNNSLKRMYEQKGKVVRVRSVDNLLREVKEAKEKYSVDFVYFLDNVFIWTETWAEEFAERYSKEVGIPFFCCVQPRHLTEKMAVELKKAGCLSVGMGVEAADDYVLQTILKKNVTRDKVIDVARVIKKHGIRLNTYNMLGIPGSSLEKEFQTLKLNIEIKPDYAGSTIFDPMPGTELADRAEQMGLLDSKLQAQMDGTHSVLTFKNNKETMMRENLAKLFPITAEFPFLLPATRFLVKFPMLKLYSAIYRAWEGYCAHFRLYPRKMSFKAFVLNMYYHLHHDRG